MKTVLLVLVNRILVLTNRMIGTLSQMASAQLNNIYTMK